MTLEAPPRAEAAAAATSIPRTTSAATASTLRHLFQLRGHWLTCFAHDLGQVKCFARVLTREKRHRRARRASTTSTTDAVNVVFDAVGKVIVDDHLHVLDVCAQQKK